MITYNHEKFVAQAINSVLMQKTNFSYELIIGEDCSTDHTRNIVLDFQKKYPGKILVLPRKKNIGRDLNFIETFCTCNGKYIAILEGDDYWMSPHKLQTQVDFLENDQNYAMSAHAVNVIGHPDHNSFIPDTMRKNPKEEYTLQDIIHENFIPTCSVVYRRQKDLVLPSWMKQVYYQDLPLHIFHAQYGKIRYSPEVMACYRVHPGGMWSNRDKIFKIKRTITIYKHLHQYFRYQSKDVKRELFNKFFHLATIYKTMKDYRNSKNYAHTSLQYANNFGKLRALNFLIFS